MGGFISDLKKTRGSTVIPSFTITVVFTTRASTVLPSVAITAFFCRGNGFHLVTAVILQMDAVPNVAVQTA